MGVLYVDRQDIEIRDEGNHLCLYEKGERRGTVPLNLLERVVLRGSVRLNAGVLTRLAERNVGVLVLGGRHLRQVAMLLGKPNGDTRRRIAQYRWHHDEAYRAEWSLALVRMKLRSQRRLLLKAARVRPDCRTPLMNGADQIERSLQNLQAQTVTSDLPSRLRGVEGSEASAYFGAFTALFPPALEFSGRNRRPPRDPVNAVLSLGYTLLHNEAVNACHIAGLDPYVGFFHEPAHNRESLAADLIEPVRARLDKWAWRLFADRRLRGEAFTRQDDACLLGKAGRQTLYVEYEQFARPVRRLLRQYALTVAKRLLSEPERAS